MADYAKQRVTMVDTQVRPSDVTKFPIIDAMLDVPREAFVPDARREMAYVGGPIEIAPGACCPRRAPSPRCSTRPTWNPATSCSISDRAWATARRFWRISPMPWSRSSRTSDLAAEAEATLADQGIDNAAVVTGPLAGGHAKAGPYDAILIFGGSRTCPTRLLDQLRDGGRIVASS
jgi:protein-L-isoaspartate(D-aspartate) O-methyltransferase